MAFERFNKPGERFSTKISVWKQGVIHISKGTMNFFALDGLHFCNLHFDREELRVGLQFTGTAHEGSVKLSHRDAGAVIPAKSFFDYYQVNYNPSRQYRLEQDPISGLLVFDLAAPLEEYQEHPDGELVETAARVTRTFLLAQQWPCTAAEEAKLVRYLFEAGAHCNWDETAMEQACRDLLLIEDDEGFPAAAAGMPPPRIAEIIAAYRTNQAHQK